MHVQCATNAHVLTQMRTHMHKDALAELAPFQMLPAFAGAGYFHREICEQAVERCARGEHCPHQEGRSVFSGCGVLGCVICFACTNPSVLHS